MNKLGTMEGVLPAVLAAAKGIGREGDETHRRSEIARDDSTGAARLENLNARRDGAVADGGGDGL